MIAADNELIGKFLVSKDEDAFKQLLQRHGPMVMSVCKSMLRHDQDAEDAFQATFLILARKAASLKARNSVAGWLFHTAVHCCHALRRKKKSTSSKESEMAIEPIASTKEPWESISTRQQLEQLHSAVDRLPERYRLPILLCDFQGLSREQTAETLDRTEASVKAALARGRKILRARLVRKGLALSALLTVIGQSRQAWASDSFLVEQTMHLAVQQLSVSGNVGASSAAAEPHQVSDAVLNLIQHGVSKMNLLSIGKLAGLAALTGVLLLSPIVALTGAISGSQPNGPDDISLAGPAEPESNLAVVQSATTDAEPQDDSSARGGDTEPELTVPEDAENSERGTRNKKLDEMRQRFEEMEDRRIKLLKASIEMKINAMEREARIKGRTEADRQQLQAEILELESQLVGLDQNMLRRQIEQQSAIPAGSNTIIQPGEELSIEFQGGNSLNRLVIVQADQTIRLPMAGVVKTEGHTVDSLTDELNNVYRELGFITDTVKFQVFRSESSKPLGK